MSRPSWDDRYRTTDLPWDTGFPSAHLGKVLDRLDLTSGPVLEIGCGTGTNAIWLAQQGFDVTAVDLSPRALALARDKAEAAGVQIALHQVDILRDALPGGPYALVFDRGCFHTFDDPGHRSYFARQVSTVLGPDGLWLSLVGSTEGPPRDMGPPRRTARDVLAAVEEWLQVVSLAAVTFDSERHGHARAWRALFTRRDVPAQPSTRRG